MNREKVIGVNARRGGMTNENGDVALLRQLRDSRRAALNLMEDAVDARALAENALAELKETRGRFEEAQEAGRIGFWEWDITTREMYWSQTMWKISGFGTPHGSPREAWRSILHPHDAAAVKDRSRKLLKSPNELRYRDEFRILRPDKTVRWIESVARIVRDDHGKALRVSGVNIDITDRKAAEDALRSSEELTSLLTESFADIAILATNTDGIVQTWNPGAKALFGYTRDEIVGRTADILFTPEDRAAGVPKMEMETARRNGRASDERWHIRKNADRFYASGVMVPLVTGGGHIGYAKIARDLTQAKKIDEELQRYRNQLETLVEERTAELEQTNASLRQEMLDRRRAEEQRIALLRRIVTTQEDERRRIARDMHDHLGQQLTGLRLKLASLGENNSSDEPLSKQVASLQEIAAKLDSEVGFLAWELRPAALDDLGFVAATQNFVTEWSRHYGIDAELHASNLGAKRLAPEVETNLYRIVQEALNNIYKHADSSNVNIVIEGRRGEIVLIIEDNGNGFEPAEIGSSDESGRGLGLVGMHERAAIVGGTLEIESAPGKGTTIFVRTPIEEEA